MVVRSCAVWSFLLSIAFLALAALVAIPLLNLPPTTNAIESNKLSPEARIKLVLPEEDPVQIRHAVAAWGSDAAKAVEGYGKPGLLTLEAFGDEACYYLSHEPRAFALLTKVVHLNQAQCDLAKGPWKQPVLDWAHIGKLDRFFDRLAALSPDRLVVAEATPCALPALCIDNAKTAQAMLSKFGVRAWRLFMAVNFDEHPEDLERVAKAVEKEGERILSLGEEFGLPFALLLVPPATDKGSQLFPEVVKHSLRVMDDRALALALMIVNHQDICDLLDAGISVDELTDAVNLFCTLPPVVQELAADHTHTLRLLTETWHGQKLGAEVLRKCGPQAADLVYTYYASEDGLKWPALVALAKLGWPVYQVLDPTEATGSSTHS